MNYSIEQRAHVIWTAATRGRQHAASGNRLIASSIVLELDRIAQVDSCLRIARAARDAAVAIDDLLNGQQGRVA